MPYFLARQVVFEDNHVPVVATVKVITVDDTDEFFFVLEIKCVETPGDPNAGVFAEQCHPGEDSFGDKIVNQLLPACLHFG